MRTGQTNVFCYVLDVAIAERIMVSDLKEHELSDGEGIAARKEDAPKVLWPHNFVRTFAVL